MTRSCSSPFFRDNGQDGVFLAWSRDGVNFRPPNGDRPVMRPGPWGGQNLTRDPSVVYQDGKFRMAPLLGRLR